MDEPRNHHSLLTGEKCNAANPAVRATQLGNKDDLSPKDDVVLVISPQSIAGHSVHPLLVDTVEQANGRYGCPPHPPPRPKLKF